MLSGVVLQNVSACIDFTRRNAPLTGEQFALVGEAMTAVQKEIESRKRPSAVITKKKKA